MAIVDLQVPQIGESVSSVFIAGWLKQVGDFVAAGDPVVEVDSDKASMEVPSPVSGVLVEQLAAEGDEVDVVAVLGRIEPGEAPEGAAAPAAEAPKEEAPAAGNTKAGPAARREAQQSGVAIESVGGTGRKGHVTTADVRQAKTQGVPSAPAPVVDQGALTERVKMSPLRRTIARRLLEAKQSTAMLTTFNEVDMSGIMALRKTYQERFVEKNGFKLGFMSFFVKATIEALKEFPAVNAEIDGNEIVYKNFYNIGVAVSTPRGLMVPVVKNADQLSFAQTEAAITELAVRARDGKLLPSDFADGTFTISNGGVFGSLMSTPILNPPQVGILGMHTIQKRPVAVDGQVVIRPMMYLAMSYDHRIIDGREAVSFLVRIKQLVENPERLLLEV